MIRSASRPLLIAGGALALVSALATPAEAQPAFLGSSTTST